jgi:manganese/iron transport system permease protein/iron/zinc/copper transport system permease protein
LTIISTLLGATCGFAGMFLSYYWDIASGPAIILLAATAFGTIFSVTGIARGIRGRRIAAPSAQNPFFDADPV